MSGVDTLFHGLSLEPFSRENPGSGASFAGVTDLRPVLAIYDNIGTIEMVIVAVVALLLFGKKLPEVASQAGSTISKFRRGLDGAIHDSGVEKEIRKIKEALPSDMSVRNAARIAARKFEDRVREVVEAPAEDAAAGSATTGAAAGAAAGAAPPADAPPPSTEAHPVPPSAPASAADARTTDAPTADAQNTGAQKATLVGETKPSAASSGEGAQPPEPKGTPPAEKSSPPATKPGVDPASSFTPPGSVPRE
jgi:TatA/E family protein of Tat protein translocase